MTTAFERHSDTWTYIEVNRLQSTIFAWCGGQTLVRTAGNIQAALMECP